MSEAISDRMTDEEIADRLGISKWTIRSWCPMSFGQWRDGKSLGLVCSFADVKEIYEAKCFARRKNGKQYHAGRRPIGK